MFPVSWLCHQGRHAELPITPRRLIRFGKFVFEKSIGKSAHHQHTLLDYLGSSGGMFTDIIFSIGDSRGAMTGEGVDSIAKDYVRRVAYSDYIATCFEHVPKAKDIPDLLAIPLHEGRTLGSVALRRLKNDLQNGDIDHLVSFLGTFDLHPMNLIHEFA